MIFNCNHEDIKKNLTIENIAIKNPSWLHRMEWTSEELISEIPISYNYLLGYYNDNDEPKTLHLTDGGPWFNYWYDKKIFTCEKYESEWLSYLNSNEILELNKFLLK